MRTRGLAFSPRGITGFTLAVLFFGNAPVAAQNPNEITPELQQVRAALNKYQDPIVAVHDGYFSTVGCIEYPKPGAPGQVPYRAGGMGIHFFIVALMG